MSLTAATWVALALALVVLSLRRPAYAVAFYVMTFFAAPQLWWWGDELPDLRYAVASGVMLLVAVLLSWPRSRALDGPRFTVVHKAAIAIALNATFVHFVIASTPSVSVDNYIELLKFILLFFLMSRAMQDRTDMRVVIMSLAVGAAYLGYEVTINERGDFSGARLEGVGAPGADTANGLASVLLLTLPVVASLFVSGKIPHKITALVAAPLTLNVVLLCNSRGAFLGLIGAGLTFVFLARGAARKQAVKYLALGSVVLYLLLGDPDIFNRFMTTFSGSEERDRSAASRLEFWRAGLLMLSDYPLGDGGGSFKFVHGRRYLTQVVGDDAEMRSLHNGYITEATEWGVQGLILRLIFLGAALRAAYRTSNRCRLEGRPEDTLMGNCLIAGAAGYLVQSVFGSFISSEWGYWIVAILLRYGEIYKVPQSVLVQDKEERTAVVGALTREWTPSHTAASRP
jgi:hypothetical protein